MFNFIKLLAFVPPLHLRSCLSVCHGCCHARFCHLPILGEIEGKCGSDDVTSKHQAAELQRFLHSYSLSGIPFNSCDTFARGRENVFINLEIKTQNLLAELGVIVNTLESHQSIKQQSCTGFCTATTCLEYHPILLFALVERISVFPDSLSFSSTKIEFGQIYSPSAPLMLPFFYEFLYSLPFAG